MRKNTILRLALLPFIAGGCVGALTKSVDETASLERYQAIEEDTELALGNCQRLKALIAARRAVITENGDDYILRFVDDTIASRGWKDDVYGRHLTSFYGALQSHKERLVQELELLLSSYDFRGEGRPRAEGMREKWEKGRP